MYYPQCLKCEYEGSEDYSLIDPAIVRCPQCDHIYSTIWCETCGIGGDFIDNIFDRPSSWTCPDCGTTQPLPAEIYDVIEGVDARQDDDTTNNTTDNGLTYSDIYRLEIEAEKNNPYRSPVFISLFVVTILGMLSGFFVENSKAPIVVMLSGATGMFVYIVVMSFKTGAFPLKGGGFVIKKRQPVIYYISLTLASLTVIFLAFLTLGMMFSG